MRPGWKTALGAALIVPGLWICCIGDRTTRGDEPSRLSRLFRFGGGSSSSSSGSSSSPTNPTPPAPSANPPGMLFTSPGPAGGPGTPTLPAGGASPRIIPQSRVSRPATESDPLVTRVSLTRSNDGSQFGMVMQVYADGTIIDNEGVHHLGPSDLKPIADVLQAGDLYRLRGHCGGPPTDYVEQVYMVVYERSLGRLKANAFSYSGNPQGCDHAVRHLHATLDALQAKLARPVNPAGAFPAAAAATGTPAPQPSGPVGESIPLTPIN